MKKSFNLIFASCVLAAFSLVSCDKDVETSPVQVDLTQKGKVEGYVYADLNLTTAGLETVPAGTKVIVSVPNNQLLSGAAGNWVDTVLTDNAGKFVAIVPTNVKGVNVSIKTVDFIADQVQPLNSHYASTPIKKVFVAPGATSVDVMPGDSKIKIIEYSNVEDFSNFVEFVSIKGTAVAELDNNYSAKENAPGIDVIFFTSDGKWSKKVTLTKETSKTTFALDIPKSKDIRYSFDFTYEIAGKTYRFKSDMRDLGVFSGDYTIEDDLTKIDLGSGIEVK